MCKHFRPIEVDGVNDTAVILCSSGTTGMFKGICQSHALLISTHCNVDIIKPDDIVFTTSALSWVLGLYTLFFCTLNGAVRIITTESYSPEMLLRIVEHHKVTLIRSATYVVMHILNCKSMWSKSQLSGIRALFVGGRKIPLHIIDEMNSYLQNGCVINAYGTTEISVVAIADYSKFKGKNTVGRLLNGYTIKIIDENGNRCGIDTDGEICIRSPCKFLGYYGNKEESKKVIDNEGFFRTGDVGHIDKDGYLYIIDRSNDMIHYV